MTRRESTEQIMLVNRIRQFYTWALVFAIPNGGRRDPKEGARMRAEGLLAGIPDLQISEARRGYFGMFIEMKRTGVGATTSFDQDRNIQKLRSSGYFVVVAYGVEDAWKHVCWYLDGEKTRVVHD